jgi:hypothetical protein
MTDVKLSLSVLPELLAICRLARDEEVDERLLSGDFCSATRTADELSIVCTESNAPAGAQSEPGWRCLKVHGPFAFTVTGVLASIASPLARAGIGIFVISTFDTDYLLVKQDDLEKAVAALSEAGHRVE